MLHRIFTGHPYARHIQPVWRRDAPSGTHAMRIVLINIPHLAIGSRIPQEQLPPLGLLAIGGPLIDDGHTVTLIDGELGNRPLDSLVAEAVACAPEAVLFGHSGSSSGHPVIAETARRVRAALPGVRVVYGGVHPTYHWRDIFREDAHVDVIVRGEGEETMRRLAAAWGAGERIDTIPGLAFRRDGVSARHPRAAR